jgi:hypothetical protein
MTESGTGTRETSGNADAQVRRSPSMPAVDFTTLVLSLRESALLHLGLKAPETPGADVELDREAARFPIEILALLQQKSQGNLNDEEDRLLRTVLYELRVAWVDGARTSPS